MKRLSMCLLFCCLAFCGSYSSLQAEIISLVVKWTGPLCGGECIKLLDREFRKISGIQEFVISGQAGQITIKWKPYASFTFQPVNVAMELVGLSINDIRIKVRGKLRHDARTVTLVSEGDNTLFDLLNPVVPQPSGQAAEFNLGARALKPDLRARLLQAEADGMTTTIEGLLFMPERSPPLELVVEQLSFVKS